MRGELCGERADGPQRNVVSHIPLTTPPYRPPYPSPYRTPHAVGHAPTLLPLEALRAPLSLARRLARLLHLHLPVLHAHEGVSRLPWRRCTAGLSNKLQPKRQPKPKG